MGFGAPDWYANRWPARPTMGFNQERYMGASSIDVPAGDTGFDEIDVPATQNLILSYVDVSTLVSATHLMYLAIDELIYLLHYFDVSCYLTFPTEGALTAAAGSTLTIYVTNNDAVAHSFYISVGGLLEEV